MRSHHYFRSYLAAFLCGLIACLPASAATLTYPEGTTVVFNPSSTLSGLNVGAIAGDPSAPVNGDIWYDSTANELTARINGANVALGSGGGSGTAAGLIYITNDAGTTTNYNPASDTDAARGTALLAAVAAATAGQTVRVGAGTFALAASRLLIPDDVDLDLDPGTLITGTANLSTVGPIVRPGNRTTVRGGKIQGVAASAVSQAPFGLSSFVSSPDPLTVDFVLDGVTLEADSDAFYILSNEACTGTIRNCTFISKYDIIYVSGYNGDPASHVVRIYNTRGIVVGPSTIASPLGRGTTIAYGATVDIHGGSLAISDGGTTLNAGVASYESGTLNLYGVKITTSNGANPNYDLYTNGSGVIRVNGGEGSGTGGIFSTNSGANVTYTGNLSAGGNGTADNGKAAIFGTGGIFDVTTELTVHNSANAAHAYLSDDGTLGFHAVGETNPRELAFPSDVLEGESKEIATKNWVTANATGNVATDAIFDAKGDLAVGTGANTAAKLTVGTNGYVLTADSAEATGIKWAPAASGGSLTATYVGYGDGANALTGEAAFAYTAASNTLGIDTIQLGATGVNITNDADGAITFTGSSAGEDEALTINLDDTANEAVISSSTGITALNTGSIGIKASGATSELGPLQTSDGKPLLNDLSVYAAGTAYTLTNTSAQVTFGTTSPIKVIDSAGTYLITVRCLVDYSAATVSAETATIKLRRTNNTAADVTGATTTLDLPVATTLTHSYGSVTLPPVLYVTTASDDSLSIFANVSATLGAGSIKISEASIVAVRIR